MVIENRLGSKFPSALKTFVVLDLGMDHLMVGQIVASGEGFPTYQAVVLFVFGWFLFKILQVWIASNFVCRMVTSYLDF